MYLDGRGLRHRSARGELIVDESYLLLLHAADEPVRFTLPAAPWAEAYTIVLDTTFEQAEPDPGLPPIPGGKELLIGPRTTMLLRVQRS
jgi:glycogen operon protein